MKKPLFAGLFASVVLCAAASIPAQAACRDTGTCGISHRTGTEAGKSALRKKTVKPVAAHHKTKPATKKTARKTIKAAKRSGPAPARASTASQASVVTLIQQMAPAQGVPTWFALRIARVESNYNAHLRGAAGEYGVFQIKCPTARDIGYGGDCSGLLDARTNVQWGLKHLAIAIGKSRGNLRLAASKHNGGLGRKTEVASYVAKVF